MGNEFSDIAYGKTETVACAGLIAGITARYPTKVKNVVRLDSHKRPMTSGEPAKYLRIEPYGDYEVVYQPVNSQILASIKYSGPSPASI